MAAPLTPASMQSSLASVSTRLSADSPLLALCATLASDCDLSADSFASRWDAFKFSHNLRQLDSSTLSQFRSHLMEEYAQQQRKQARKDEQHKSRAAAAAGAAAASGYVVNGGGGKRVYSKETLSELLAEDEMLAGLLPMTSVRVKRETQRDHGARDDGRKNTSQDVDEAWSGKDERKDSDVFTTPSVARHRSSPAISASSGSTMPVVPISPFTPFSGAGPLSSQSPSQSTSPPPSAAPASAYQSRSDAGQIVATLHSTLAPASPYRLVDNNNDNRTVDVEVLLTTGELADAEEGRPFRFGWFAGGGEEVRELLAERMELMVQALMATSDWQQMAAVMKADSETAIGGGSAVKDEAKVKAEEEKKQPEMEVDDNKEGDAASGKDERKEDVATVAAEQRRPAVTVKRDADLEWTDWEDEVGLSSTVARSQQSVVVSGRVCVDANSDESRLTVASVCLEGSMSLSHCHRISLRLGSQQSFSLFPGQIVLAKGVNAHGTAMVVEQLVTAAPPPVLSLLASAVLRYNPPSAPPLIIVAAAGPFTTSDDQRFFPLADLVARVNALHADVLVLQGPFLDASHPLVVAGEVDVDEKMADLWPELFSSLNAHTRVIIQPSTKDAVAVPIFPQPALSFPHPRHVTLVPNPATVRVNDIVLGLTSLDVMSHFVSSSAALTRNVRTKRLPHIASLLVAQQSYYPLFPPPVTADCVDCSHSLRFGMPLRPDVLLLPSALGRFASDGSEALEGADGDVDDGATIVVNGGALARGSGGGTYAVICVHGKSDEEMARTGSGDEGRVVEHLVPRRTRVDICRI